MPRSRARLMGTIALGWITGLAQLALYIVLGRALDQHLTSGSIEGWIYAIAIVAALVAAGAAWAGPARAGREQGLDEAMTRHDLMNRIITLGPTDRDRAGRLVSTATDGVERAAAFRATFLGPMIASMTLPLLVLVVIAIWVNPVIAGFLAIGVVLVPAAIGGFQMMFRSVSTRYRGAARGLAAQFLDAIQGLPTLRLLGTGPDMGKRLSRSAQNLRRMVMRLLAGNQVMLFVVDSVFALAFVVVSAYFAMSYAGQGLITIGQALTVILASTLLLEPLDRIGQFFYVGMGGIASVKEIRQIMAEQPAVSDPAESGPAMGGVAGNPTTGSGHATPDPIEPPLVGASDPSVTNRAAPAISFDHVQFAYSPDTPVLTDADFNVGRGERVALTGVSGAGKTTIAALLGAERRPSGGRISLFGHDIMTVPLAWQHAQLSTVTQDTYLFSGTLRHNLLIASPDATDDDLWQALTAADLADFIATLPKGLDTAVGERGLSLSGGQSQRLAIARAYLKDAPILILDEPTAHVDLASERAILDALHRLGSGRSVLTISHRQATIADADRVLELTNGTVVARPQLAGEFS